MLLTPNHAIVASVAMNPSIYTQPNGHVLPGFVRPAFEKNMMIKKSPAKTLEKLVSYPSLDDMREETLFSPLLIRKQAHSYSLSSKRKAQSTITQGGKLRNRPWTFATQLPSMTMSLLMALVLNVVAKLIMYPAYSLSLAYSKLR